MSSYTQLTQRQRYQIELYRNEFQLSQAEIARRLGVSPSTISRELRRNSRPRRGYQAERAHQEAQARRRRKARRRIPEALWRQVEVLLRQRWSPQQISQWLRKEGRPSVSHERIYQWILADKRRGGDLYLCLRQSRRRRRKRYGSTSAPAPISGRVPIEQRPAVVERRSRLGDWEADTLVGRGGSGALVSLTERRSRLVRLARVARRKADGVARQVITLLQPLAEQVLTLTSDNGGEFAQHRRIAQTLGADFYFARPYAAWQRGSNENANGLIRQYFPKSRRFDTLTEAELQLAVQQLNDRPRHCLEWRTPNEVFFGPDSSEVKAWRARLQRIL